MGQIVAPSREAAGEIHFREGAYSLQRNTFWFCREDNNNERAASYTSFESVISEPDKKEVKVSFFSFY